MCYYLVSITSLMFSTAQKPLDLCNILSSHKPIVFIRYEDIIPLSFVVSKDGITDGYQVTFCQYRPALDVRIAGPGPHPDIQETCSDLAHKDLLLVRCPCPGESITIRTYAQKPVSSVAEGVREDISRAKRYGRKNTGNAEKDDPLLFVYHSVDHPELFIEEHEYSFVVYYDDGVNPLKKLRVEPKEQR